MLTVAASRELDIAIDIRNVFPRELFFSVIEEPFVPLTPELSAGARDAVIFAGAFLLSGKTGAFPGPALSEQEVAKRSRASAGARNEVMGDLRVSVGTYSGFGRKPLLC
jgi:hypothetical protein